MKDLINFYTAESVSPKHPDKLCDQISDAILDAYLKNDPHARVAVEVCGGHGEIFIVGEVSSRFAINVTEISHIVERITRDKNLKLSLNLVQQSPEIAQGVDAGGAGDQGIMIGYACDETPELLPLEVILSRKLNQYIFEQYPYDGKTQVTLHKINNRMFIESIVASFQNTSHEELLKIVNEFIAKNTTKYNLDDSTPTLHINPSGDWHQGGFEADTGLTGRKLIVDNYGPRIPIGGGAFSGKDPSKVDRSAAYMARRIAVDYLRKRQAHTVLVRLAYAIGFAEPLERTVIIDGVAEQIEGYDLTPHGIIKHLSLLQPFYEPTARYGHFGNGFNWDK